MIHLLLTFKNHDFALLDFMIGSFTTNHIHNEESIIENICKEEDLELNKHLAKVFLIEYIRNEKDKLNQSINYLTVVSKSIN